MKKIKEYWFQIILSVIALAIIFGIYDEIANFKEIPMKGVVKSHYVTFDRSGTDVSHRTLVLCEDGAIEEVVGVDAYVIPVGNNIYFKTRRRKK